MAEDSLKKRYFFKLSSSLVGLLVNLVTQSIVPRALGPAAYGNFSFLTSFFSNAVGMVDNGSSSAFYFRQSRAPHDVSNILFYFSIMGVVSAVIILLPILSLSGTVRDMFWPGQEGLFIAAAALWAILLWASQIAEKMVDAGGYTVQGEKIKLLQRVVGLCLIATLFLGGMLNLRWFFLYHYIILLLLTGGLLAVWRSKQGMPAQWLLSGREWGRIFGEYYHYCHPLVVYSVVLALIALLDRWLLQYFGGSVEQGFFGLGYNVGTICFLFTGAMTPLFMREISIFYGKGDEERMRDMFKRYIPLFYAVSVFIAAYVAVQAGKISILLGGGGFAGASFTVALMAFYPVHQTYGQLSGSVFMATDNTRVYRNIGIIMGLVGIPVTFFMVAPHSAFGLELGASGLAIKFLVLQAVAVNLQLWHNTKQLKLHYWYFLRHQVYVIAVFLANGAVAVWLGNSFFQGTLNSFIVGGLLYICLGALVIYIFPAIVGMSRLDLVNMASGLFGRKKAG